MNPALETTDLETLFKIALTDDSIESRRRARLNVLQQSFDLEKAHDPQFLEFLGKTIKNPSATVRRRAAELLCFVPDLEESLLHSLASDKNWIVRDAFWKSLLTKFDQTPEIEIQWLGSAVKAAIEDHQPHVRAACLQLLQRFSPEGRESAIERLEQSLESKKFTHRIRSLHAFQQLVPTTPAKVDGLVKRLDDSHINVRAAAARTISELAKAGLDLRFALPQLVKRSFDSEQITCDPARSAIETLTKQIPSLNDWLSNLIEQNFRSTNDQDQTFTNILELYLRQLKQVKESVRAQHQTACDNRIRWGHERLKGAKLNVFQQVHGKSSFEIADETLIKFAIKETIWLITDLTKRVVTIDKRS